MQDQIEQKTVKNFKFQFVWTGPLAGILIGPGLSTSGDRCRLRGNSYPLIFCFICATKS